LALLARLLQIVGDEAGKLQVLQSLLVYVRRSLCHSRDLGETDGIGSLLLLLWEGFVNADIGEAVSLPRPSKNTSSQRLHAAVQSQRRCLNDCIIHCDIQDPERQ
jgi:hypothetical protein